MNRLIIDAQVFQTQALHRGMGKYSIELLDALDKLADADAQWDAIDLVVSSKSALAQEAVEMLSSRVARARVVKLKLKKDVIYSAHAIMEHNRSIIDKYVEKHYAANPSGSVDFLILSPMQGGISSVFPSDVRVRKSAIFYDLIPYMFHDLYFRNEIARIENLTKITELLKADVLLPISKTVANDLAVYLAVDPGRIHNIDGGPISHSKQKKTIKVPHPFILMPTGNDLRKNNRTAILGFNEFNKKHDNKYGLVITSFFDPAEIQELSSLAANVVFVGNISGEELNYLYEECEVLLFPSEYEGLGLPVLEAVEKDKPVACSDIAVFREISKQAFSFFDPQYGTAIAHALEDALQRTIDKSAYKKILAKYNWDTTATAMVKAMLQHPIRELSARPSVAIFGENPQGNQLQSRLLQSTYAELIQHIQPTYFVDGYEIVNASRPYMLQFAAGTVDMNKANTPIDLQGYDAVVYNIANSSLSTKVLFSALANPGIAVLYDLDLSAVWQALQEQGLVDESRVLAEEKLNSKHAVAGANMLCSVLASQKVVVVFSEDAKNAVTKLLQKMKLEKPVVALKAPVTTLVHEEITPTKDSVAAYCENNDQQAASNLFAMASTKLKKIKFTYTHQIHFDSPTVKANPYERQYEEAVSRTKVVSAGATNVVQWMGAARYGAVPIYLKTSEPELFTVPKNVLVVDDKNELTSLFDKIRIAPKDYESIAKDLRTEILAEYSYAAYAKNLSTLINKLTKEGQ